MTQIRKFVFDTEFDAQGRVLRQGGVGKLAFTPEELEAAKRAARAEGERAATAQAERAAAEALARIAAALAAILARLDQESARLKCEAVDLGLAAARALAREALAAKPEAAAAALIAEMADELRAAPRIVIRLAGAAADAVRPRLQAVAAEAGLTGSLVLETAAGPAGDCTIEWGEGAVARATEAGLARLDEIARRWLAHECAQGGQLELFAA